MSDVTRVVFAPRVLGCTGERFDRSVNCAAERAAGRCPFDIPEYTPENQPALVGGLTHACMLPVALARGAAQVLGLPDGVFGAVGHTNDISEVTAVGISAVMSDALDAWLTIDGFTVRNGTDITGPATHNFLFERGHRDERRCVRRSLDRPHTDLIASSDDQRNSGAS